MVLLIICVFIIGYLAIALEHNIKINKSAPALIIGVLCWTIYIMMTDKPHHEVFEELNHYLSEISGVLFFLLGAMTIVELIDAHEGFEPITKRIKLKSSVQLLWVIGILTFFLSALLDNLTTTIVMISILRKLIKSDSQRMTFVGLVVISANAGGAWSPIGDVTTTMLWIKGLITTHSIILNLIVPSLICLLVPILLFVIQIKKAERVESNQTNDLEENGRIKLSHAKISFVSRFEKIIVLILGVGGLVFVPIFKYITHLPPFMGILFSLGVMWLVTEILHKDKNDEAKDPLSVMGVLTRVDVPSVLFFFGILVAISSMQATGILADLALWLDQSVGNNYIIAILLGLLSSIVDNVPLVAAAMGMYTFPTDHNMWQFIAYCAGTGGSVLIIGSAAGVAAMGMEKISFGWYVRKISLIALAGYLAGALYYIALH